MAPNLRCALICLALALPTACQEPQTAVRIGVVAAYQQAELARQYEPLTRYLAKKIPGHRFEIVRLANIDEALGAVERREIDFVNCSPSVFVELDLHHGARALVTQVIGVHPGEGTPWMAGAVFYLRERTDIRTLADLRDKRVIGLDPRTLGGWLSVLRELDDLGIQPARDLAEVSFGGTYDRVVKAVLDGSADVGVLSAMAFGAATEDMSVADRFRVLPPPRPIDPGFPYPASTRLYPESPLVVLPYTSARLADRMAVALLSLGFESEAVRVSYTEGYTLPLSYQSVHECLKQLRVAPYENYGRVTLADAARQHSLAVSGVLSSIIVVLTVGVVAVLSLNRRLRRSHQGLSRQAQLLAQASDAIIGLDPELRVTSWNNAAERLLGWRSQEARGRRIAELAPGFPVDAARQVVAGSEAPGGKWAGEVTLATRSGVSAVCEVAIAPLRGDHGDVIGFVSQIRDVTLVRNLEQQYKQAQKLESVGRLAGGIAHDFNNLLTVINGYGDLILEQAGEGHPLHAPVREIRKAGGRATELTQQLLAFGRRQITQPRPLDLNRLVTDARGMFQRLVGEDVQLRTALEPALGLVTADSGQMMQLLMNLVANARDAMPAGGSLIIETANLELASGSPALHPEAKPGRYILLSVTDTGLGMDKETVEHIFEPFFTTKEEGKGTGLGLSTAYGIVRQCGGWIAVRSEPGRGSTFSTYLPRAPQDTLTKAAPAAGKGDLRGSETVLLVEDQSEVRTLASEILRGYGYRVLEAGSAAEGIRLARGHEGPIDLLLTDVIMPQMTGRQLAETLLRERPSLRVVYMSGYPEDVISKQGALEPRVNYLQKPFAPSALAAKVHEALAAA